MTSDLRQQVELGMMKNDRLALGLRESKSHQGGGDRLGWLKRGVEWR